MAKQDVNKSEIIRQYRAKHPTKTPSEIADLILQEQNVKVSPNFVSAVKAKKKTPSKKKAPAATPTTTATPSQPRAKETSVSLHIANLKAAAAALGKDEAKRIIELF